MKDIFIHWAWHQAIEDFKPLGTVKMLKLATFLRSGEFKEAEQALDIDYLFSYVMQSRHQASQIWAIYKHDIENNTLHIQELATIPIQPIDEKLKAKKPKKKAEKKATKKVKKDNNILCFKDHKKNKVS